MTVPGGVPAGAVRYANEEWALPTLVLGWRRARASRSRRRRRLRRWCSSGSWSSCCSTASRCSTAPSTSSPATTITTCGRVRARLTTPSPIRELRQVDQQRDAASRRGTPRTCSPATDTEPVRPHRCSKDACRATGSRSCATCEVHSIDPNLGIVERRPAPGLVVFHHGHYAESLYRLVSTITGMMFPDRKRLPTSSVHEWEAENFAWGRLLLVDARAFRRCRRRRRPRIRLPPE